MAQGDTPEISAVIGTLMEHPELLETILSLLRPKVDAPRAETEIEASPAEEAEAVSASPPLPTEGGENDRRDRLFHALRPYLSENRARTMDSVLGVMHILDAVRRTGR